MHHDDTGDTLPDEMLVTFGADELDAFFDGFQSIEEIALTLCAPLGLQENT